VIWSISVWLLLGKLNFELLIHSAHFRQALANKMQWGEIQKWIDSAAKQGNPIAERFVRLMLMDNTIVLRLSDPYEHLNEPTNEETDEQESSKGKKKAKPKQPTMLEVELDLDLTADQNARHHFTERKSAAVKQQKTLQSSNVALKNAQKQAQNKVKQVSIGYGIELIQCFRYVPTQHWLEHAKLCGLRSSTGASVQTAT
jgi:hypothetical protein